MSISEQNHLQCELLLSSSLWNYNKASLITFHLVDYAPWDVALNSFWLYALAAVSLSTEQPTLQNALHFPGISIPRTQSLFRKFQNLADISINLSAMNIIKQKSYTHELQSSFPHHDLYHDHNSDRLPTMLCALASPCWHLEKKALMRNMLLMLQNLKRWRHLVGEK